MWTKKFLMKLNNKCRVLLHMYDQRVGCRQHSGVTKWAVKRFDSGWKANFSCPCKFILLPNLWHHTLLGFVTFSHILLDFSHFLPFLPNLTVLHNIVCKSYSVMRECSIYYARASPPVLWWCKNRSDISQAPSISRPEIRNRITNFFILFLSCVALSCLYVLNILWVDSAL